MLPLREVYDNFIKSIGASGGRISNAVELMSFLKTFWSGKLFDPSIFEVLAPSNRLQMSFYLVCLPVGT